MVRTTDLVTRIRSHLSDGLQRDILNAAVDLFVSSDNPLRTNLFACAIRELFRIVLAELAPDATVKKCCWFECDSNARSGVTRKDRMRFAVQGGLPLEFVAGELNLDVEGELKLALQLINALNKYTHVSSKTFNVAQDDGKQIFADSMETLDDLFSLIETLRDSVRRQLHDALTQEVSGALYENVYDALDELSTHTSVDETQVEDFWVVEIGSDLLRLEGEGTVGVQLQYGSNSDLKKDIGVVTGDSFPFSFKAEARVVEPLKILLSPSDIEIDNSDWWN